MDDLIVLLCGFGFVVISIWLLVWAYYDAENRGQSGCLVGALIFFAGIPGIIIWLIVRDGLTQKATRRPKYRYDRKCPFCGEYIKKEAMICGYCGSDVSPVVDVPPPPQKKVCPDCGTICKAYEDFCPACLAAL